MIPNKIINNILGCKPCKDVRSRNNGYVTKLTVEEDKMWNNIFGEYIQEGMSDSQAEKQTTKEMIKIYPRLQNYSKWE